MRRIKTLNLGKIKIHLYPTDFMCKEFGFSIASDYFEISLIWWCIEINW